MLKNTREYLKNKLKNIIEQINKYEGECEKLEFIKAESGKLIDSYYSMIYARNNAIICIIRDILLVIAGLIFVYFVFSPTSKLFILIAGMIGATIVDGFNKIREYKKRKKCYEDIHNNIQSFNPGDYDDIDEFKSEQYYKIMRQIEYYEKNISNNKEFIEAIWLALSSDNFVDSITKYYEKYVDFGIALQQEWTAYLDEVSKFYPEDVRYVSEEELLKNEPVKLNLTPKCEKAHNLAIK